MTFFQNFTEKFKDIANISDHIDKPAASRSIRSNIYFRGPNVWILAFSIVIASVGLNVNSIAVIIGAMLVSPLMGPIFGVGLGLGTNDIQLLKDSAKNLLIMVSISLVASFLYFLITPLSLSNPTELLARTNPTIYDVLIALFGGFAGIFELCRKEKGTVLSGVAIATALMPPLCTAGFGLAQGNIVYFAGALYLFLINNCFITLATYITVKYLKFTGMEFNDEKVAKKTKMLVGIVVLVVTIPSIWSAVVMVKENNFNEHAMEFIAKNKTLNKGYIYDQSITHHKGSKLEIFIAGEPLTDQEKAALIASAGEFNIKPEQLIFNENMAEKPTDEKEIIKSIYEHMDSEIAKKDAEIGRLENVIKEMQGNDIPYVKITKEAVSQFSQIREMLIAKGANAVANSDAYHLTDSMVVIVKTDQALSEENKDRLQEWLKIRLEHQNIILINTVIKQ